MLTQSKGEKIKIQNKQQRFDQLLIEAIDDALCSLGEEVKNDIYNCLEKDFSITKHGLPQHIGEFSNFLYRIFGPYARFVEIKCMKRFYSKIENDQYLGNMTVFWDDSDFTLLTYANKFRAAS